MVPSFWSVPTWKAAVFMHRDVALLEQVFSHQVQNTKHFLLLFILGTSSLFKAFAKHGLDSDVEEGINSDTESEEEGRDDGAPEQKQDDTPLGKQGDTAGTVH